MSRDTELLDKLQTELAAYEASQPTVSATLLAAEVMLGRGYEADEVEAILMVLLLDICEQGEQRGGLAQMFSALGDMFNDIGQRIAGGNLMLMEEAVDEKETKPSLPGRARARERSVRGNGRVTDRGHRPPPTGRSGRRKS